MTELLASLLRSGGALALVILLVRLNGLRSFSKMSGFDFALTLAIGSTLATAATADKAQAYLVAMTGLVALFAVQGGIARLRAKSETVQSGLDNGPILPMEEGEMIDDNLKRANVTRSDIVAKLREANVLRYSAVRAVVLETTGDISVLHGSADLEDALLDGVRR